jgi:hypothetical protein
MLEAAEPELAEHERPVTGDALQPCQVGLETITRLEVHVEAHEVHERQVEVLRRGIVHVRDERARILELRGVIQPFEIPFHARPAVPAYDGCGNLVADGVAQHGGMTGTCPYALADTPLDGPGALAVVEERHVLLPRDADHHGEPVTLGRIQQVAWRHRVRTNGVEAVRRDRSEVAIERSRVAVAVGVRAECSVRHALHQDLVAPPVHELATGPKPRRARSSARSGRGARHLGPLVSCGVRRSLEHPR